MVLWLFLLRKAKQMKILTGQESSKWIKWHAKDEMKFHFDDRESYIQKYFLSHNGNIWVGGVGKEKEISR